MVIDTCHKPIQLRFCHFARKNLLSCILRSAQLWRLRMAVVLRPLWGKIHQNPRWWFRNTTWLGSTLGSTHVYGVYYTKPTFFSERVVLAVLNKLAHCHNYPTFVCSPYHTPIPSQARSLNHHKGHVRLQAHWTWTWWKSQTKPMLDSYQYQGWEVGRTEGREVENAITHSFHHLLRDEWYYVVSQLLSLLMSSCFPKFIEMRCYENMCTRVAYTVHRKSHRHTYSRIL